MAWHLLHPAAVHFAVAFIVIGVPCEVAGLLGRRRSLAAWGSGLVLAGTMALVPTVVSGFLAANTARVPDSALHTLQGHERAGLAALAVFVLGTLWKAWFGGAVPAWQHRLYAAWLLLGLALVGWGAWLGAELVYLHGVGVRTP